MGNNRCRWSTRVNLSTSNGKFFGGRRPAGEGRRTGASDFSSNIPLLSPPLSTDEGVKFNALTGSGSRGEGPFDIYIVESGSDCCIRHSQRLTARTSPLVVAIDGGEWRGQIYVGCGRGYARESDCYSVR